MLPDIRVEQYQEAADKVSFDGIKWLTKYDVKIKFADRDVAYATKDRIDKFLQGEDYCAMYLKVRDELAELQQLSEQGAGMTRDDIIRMAKEAGLPTIEDTGEILGINSAIRFANLVAAAERENCARVAEAVVPRHTECGNKIAAAIRARGQK